VDHTGYRWTIRPADGRWAWSILGRDDGRVLVQGEAPSRAVAAAMVVRAIARGVVTGATVESLAA